MVRAVRLCYCGSPLSGTSGDRCEQCAAAWEVWGSVDIWGDQVVCPTCDRLADDDLYPTDDGELRCRQCIDDERSAERDEEDG